jgi:hypothetical protein
MSPLNFQQVRRLLDPESDFTFRFPLAAEIMGRLIAADFSVNQVLPVPHGIWIGLTIHVAITVYTRKGTVVVQGASFENGASGNALKKILPPGTRWQR